MKMLRVMKISKQVIVMRTDLKNDKGHKVRTGKLIAQACHASVKAVLNSSQKSVKYKNWEETGTKKICLSVDSEEELLEVYNKAKTAGLICALVTDSGLTEFNGVATKTCCAIGPEWSEDIDKITGQLKLL